MMSTYTLYGFSIQTTFPCPMLTPAPDVVGPDVTMIEGAVPEALPEPVATGDYWQATPGRFLWLGGARAGRFLVEGGRQITLERGAAVEEAMLAAHLLSAVLAALLRQRGMLVLHANTAVTPRGAVTVTGETGAGKSTALAAMMAQGCAMLADDITVLRLGPTGVVEVLPGIAKLNLCEDAAERLGHPVADLPRNPMRRIKVVVPVCQGMAADPIPLHALYFLGSSSGDEVELVRLTGMDKFAALQTAIYGPFFSEDHHGHFSTLGATVNQARMFRLNRPSSRWSAREVADVMISEPCDRPG